ncbi:MAG: glycosyltransferase family 1 protein [Sphingobium sp.]|nr:glycosyltransferase family 1 protein [Sphingobium sp.]MBP6112336.1 glycosyltransferase family 1 protein [Sphingobium sp.]MBP8672229.1 glycosyltransferase family 1 protein [Sphingobium sp.]MBP9157313.1 glycosyltransferase family 1 protein [Sphingobium sp.]MCC6482538.1 glycosyltransferase family 1 protein [Sphingomonadaceae bacterium]
MKIAIVTDAWHPQVNGVVRTLDMTIRLLQERGHDVGCITPDQFLTLPMPGYSQIRLAVAPRIGARRRLAEIAPDVVHIVTEGPIGWSARKWCIDHDVPFTTAFHTRFPDYAAVRTGLSAEYFWPVMRRFHNRSAAIFVSTERLRDELDSRAIYGGRIWSRGIDTRLFRPDGPRHAAMEHLPKPVLLSVGRIAAEKNLEAFLHLDVPGTKVIVGDGPALATLRQRYPDALFLGAFEGDDLASAYRAADVFVFPSLTDTFGMVMIEALACGTPVAGFPVAGPLDIVGDKGRGVDNSLTVPVGALDDDLASAIRRAAMLPGQAAADYGASYDWNRCTDQFIAGLCHAFMRPKVDQGRRRVMSQA